MLSKNAPLAELRLFLVLAPLNMPQTPTKLALNRTFHVDTYIDREEKKHQEAY